MAQQIINTGAVANDGTGDPLRTAFTETNDNFTEIYTAGPVGSNVRIANNTILTLNTNGNLVLAPNGIGKVVANVDVVPNTANIRNLGSSTQRWSTVYTQYLNVTNGTTVAGDLTVGGNLTVTGNTVQIGNLVTDAKTLQLANTAANANAANGAGVTVGASDNIATLLYNSTGNVWTTNIGVSAVGNITAPYFIGDGSQLTNISVGNSGAVQFNWQGSLSNQGGTPGDTYSTLQFDSNGMPTLDGTSAYQQRVDYSPYLQVLAPRVESTDFDVVAGPGITVVGYDDNYNIPRSAYMSVQDQATATQQWDFGILGNGSNSFSVRNRTASTIPLAISTDGTVTASTIITNDISSDDSSFVTIQDGLNVVGDIETRGNVTADYFIGDGSQLTGLPASYNNSNVTTLLSNLGSNVISGTGNITTTANISGAYILGNGSALTNLPAPAVAQDITSTGDMSMMTYDGNLKYVNYATVEPASGTIKSSGNISATGNVVGGNIRTVGLISSTGNVTGGNILTAGIVSATGNVSGNFFIGNGSQLTGIAASYGNANVATFLAAFGSNAISTTGNVTASNFVGNISITGNVVGTQPNVTLVAGSYSTVFDNTGNLTLPGNTFSVNYANNTPVPVVTRAEGTWTVTAGNNNYSFTVPINNTYQLWINGNIPNGIIVYNATVGVSNTNVPVIGQQFAWNYEGGGNILMFTSIPAQIIGTAGAIANASPAVANTNVFTFGINNTSGSNQTVQYGWIQIS
jgi:hypothetical protein